MRRYHWVQFVFSAHTRCLVTLSLTLKPALLTVKSGADWVSPCFFLSPWHFSFHGFWRKKENHPEWPKWVLHDGAKINLLWQMDRFIAAHCSLTTAPWSSVRSFVSLYQDTVKPRHGVVKRRIQNKVLYWVTNEWIFTSQVQFVCTMVACTSRLLHSEEETLRKNCALCVCVNVHYCIMPQQHFAQSQHAFTSAISIPNLPAMEC